MLLLEEYLRQFYFQIDIVMEVLVRSYKMLDSTIDILPASDEGPTKSELYVTEHAWVNLVFEFLLI